MQPKHHQVLLEKYIECIGAGTQENSRTDVDSVETCNLIMMASTTMKTMATAMTTKRTTTMMTLTKSTRTCVKSSMILPDVVTPLLLKIAMRNARNEAIMDVLEHYFRLLPEF